MKVIETPEEYASFTGEINQRSSIIVIPILADPELHYMNNKLSLLYVRTFDGETYILVFDHSESEHHLHDLPDFNPEEIWTDDQIVLSTYLAHPNIKDASMHYYLRTNQMLFDDDFETTAHLFISRRFPDRPNLNRIIPIVKHVESCDIRSKQIIKTIAENCPDAFDTYTEILDTVGKIENSGIVFDMPMFWQEHGDRYDKHFKGDKLFSRYNFYTSTGRPSNSFGNFNFAAIKKGDHRKMIIPENDTFLLFDYDSYHLHLIAKVINFEFPERNAHTYLGKQYFNKTTLTEEEYNDAKVINFKYMYGGAPMEIRETVPFFKKLQDYSNDLWREFSRKKYITSLTGRRIWHTSIETPNPKKVVNYLIQLIETETNMVVLKDVMKFLVDKKSKMILYTYDSFLFDVSGEDGREVMQGLYDIIDIFPTTVQMGWNYNDMADISYKFS